MTKYFFILLILYSGIANGQGNLPSFLELAEANSPTLNDNLNQIEISRIEEMRLRKEIIGPQVYASADYLLAPYFNNPTFIDANPQPKAIGYDVNTTNGGQYAALINVNKPLFAGKILEANLQAQRATQGRTTFSRALAKRDLFKQVSDQYIKVYQDQKNAAINIELLTIISDQVTIISTLVESGLRKRSDALLIELEKKNQETSLRNAQNQWHQDMRDLYTLCGVTDTAIVTLEKPQFQSIPTTNDGESFIAQYAADSLNAMASTALFNVRYRTTFNLFGNAGLNAVSLNGIQRKVGFSIGAGIKIPIFDGNQRHLNDQKNKIALQTISQYKTQKQIEIANNVSKYESAINSQKENLLILENQVADYKALFDQYKAELGSGLISVIDYVNGIRLYRTFQSNLITARANLLSLEAANAYWNW